MLSPRSVFRLFEQTRPSTELLFDPESARKLLDQPEVAHLLDGSSVGGTYTASEAVLLVFRALAIQRSRLEPRLADMQLVGTVPGGADVGIRSTRMVIREMIRGAEARIDVLGFEISDSEFIGLLGEAAASARVRLLVDRERGSAERIASGWPESLDLPAIFTNRPGRGELSYEKMHSKAILVDGRDLLITSANLTLHGMEGNFELGVRLWGSPAERTQEMISRMLDSDLVERWEGG